MANKHLSEDEIQYTVNVKTAKAQQEIHKLETQSAALRNENKQRLQQMIKLEASGKKETEQYQKLAASYKDTGKQIKELTSKIQEQTKSLDTNAMTMSQLRKQSKSLQRELDNLSQSLNPKQYAELENRLQTVNARMAELKQNAKNFKEIASSDEYNSFFFGQLAVKGIEMFTGWVKSLAGKLTDTIDKSVELAESADGITHAFEKIGTKDYLQSLRDATKGTVSDIELMKAAVKAKDFRIPLEDLGKYLSFAQLKAQQTGQSLDYMVDSIVTGLGRKSTMTLDNLGLSAAEIGEKTKETGDFMKGVASIVEGQLAAAGETYISAADRAAKRTVDLENAQLELGQELLPLKEEFSNVYGQIELSIIKVIKYLVQHRDTLIALGKVVLVITATYAAYVAGQKLAWAWSMKQIVVSKLKAAAIAIENAALELSVLRHATLNGTMKKSIALQKAFNIVLKLSPWGLVLGGITLVVGALLLFNKRTSAVAQAQKKLNEVKQEATRKVEEERIKIERLTKRIHDNTLSIDERKAAIAALQEIVPDYTAKLSQEGKIYDENTESLKRYVAALKEKALIEGAKNALNDLGDQKAALIVKQTEQESQLEQLKKEQAATSASGRLQTSGGAVAASSVHAASGYAAEVAALSNKIQKTEEKIKAVDVTMDALNKAFGKKLYSSANKDGGSPSSKAGTIGAEIDDITKKIEILKQQRLTIKVGDTKGLKEIDKQISDLEQRKAKLEYSSKSGGDKKKSKTTDPDTATAKDFSHDRAQDLDEAKAAYQQDLNALKQALAEKRLTQEQYDAYISALNIQHQNNLLAIEESYRQRSQDLVMKDGEKKKTLQEQQDKAVSIQQQAADNAYIEAEKQYYAALDQLQAVAPSKPQTLQQECDAKLLVLDGYYQASLQLAADDAEKQKQLTEAYEMAKTNIIAEYAKKAEEEKARARQEYGLDTFDDQYAARAKEIQKAYDEGVINKQQYEQAMTNLEKQAEEQRMQIRQQYGLVKQKSEYQQRLEQLQEFLRQGLINQEEYEKAVSNMRREKWKADFDQYSSLFGSSVQALQQAEMDNVDAKYDAEIEAAKNAGEDTTDIEKKKADEKLKVQKKYADVNFAIKASQIVADTAVSIMQAYAQLGPIAGTVAAVLMGITGAAQLASANAERQRVKRMTLSGTSSSTASSGTRVATGLESGGSIDVRREQDGKLFRADYDPDRRGFVDKPTVIVGEGGYGHSREWVASNAAVENPTVAPIIDIIDRAQRAGNIRTLDMNKFLIQQAQGRASGGMISPTANDVRGIAQDSYKDTLITRLTDVLDRLASDGIPASVALDQLEQKQQLRDKARKFGSK